ncbi:unnamed protein product [Miscanthus lutarioriparius]|uniref:Uncharacterized protein n=1 Tax=Miscanthus lutarioriparius TaxID=422564 RepID=A0A811MMI2_9POAL|nr:unnamed protein product [Miscanthus lutarioriparius]
MSSATFHFPTPGVRALLTLALDFRKRMYAPLPWGYYDSVVHFTRVRADLDVGLPAVAAALDHHVAGVPEDELWRAVEWLDARQQQEGGGAQAASGGDGWRPPVWVAAGKP